MKKIYSNEIKSSTEFKSWKAMITRCYYLSNNIGNYKLLNIKVCPEWRYDFFKFLQDMGKKPSLEHSLDRIDSSKNYSKENCRWATNAEQSRNKSNNRFITYQGETLILKDWAKKLNMSYKLLHQRIVRDGLDFETAINTPVLTSDKRRTVEINGLSKSVRAWCKEIGINNGTVNFRIKKGWDPLKALLTPVKTYNKPEK